MSGNSVRVAVANRGAIAALRAIENGSSEAARKRALRRALIPIRNRLRAEWKATSTHHKGAHLRAIAAATVVDVRRSGSRGADAPVLGRVGVDYGATGAKIGHRQRIWHLLESGFLHKATGKRVSGRGISRRIAFAMVGGATKAAADEIEGELRRIARKRGMIA